MAHHRCSKLHLTITLKDCETLRNRPQWGGQHGGPGRPPQCNGCEDWMQWDGSNGRKLERFDAPALPEYEESTPTTMEELMPPEKKVGICAGCGEEKTLLSKTHCHQCVKNQHKADEPKKSEKLGGKVALDFTQDEDLLRELTASAHLNYRTLPNEILASLRASFVEKPRPSAGEHD